jgi:hypothetical protein
MHRRAAQIACLLLLLASMGPAQASTRATDFTLAGQTLMVALLRGAAAVTPGGILARELDRDTPATEHSQTVADRVAWMMRPPAAQSVRLQSVTGSGL